MLNAETGSSEHDLSWSCREDGSLGKLPPLVQPKECDRLKQLLAECGRGERFIVQGGDCAERFMDCEAAAEILVVETLTGDEPFLPVSPINLQGTNSAVHTSAILLSFFLAITFQTQRTC